jgi:2-polyprenyl-3-methyl-5-hydroxy-6-metoxy-1,4-benzoquinol methylase
MELLKKCPACDHEKFVEFIQCKDHFLSKEDFTILKCENCGLLFTNPRPEENDLGRYYKSSQYISHSNAKKGLINKIYHFIRRHNHKKKYKLISSYRSKGEILDVGCATGEFLLFLKQKGWNVFGIEPDADARQFAIENNKIEAFPESELVKLGRDKFDVITLWHVLEHVSNLKPRITELYNLLKDDGILIIAVPNSQSLDAAHYGSFWAGYDVPRHLYHFDQKVIKDLFSKFNFSCIEIKPMKFDSYYVSLLSEKYISGKNNYLKAAKTGWQSNCHARKNQMNYSSLIYIFKKEKT